MKRLVLGAGIVISAGAAQAQGFFDYFFRGFRPPPPPMAYMQAAPVPKLQRNPVTDGYMPGQEPSSKPELRPPPPVGKGPLGPFLFDPTLQSGDVVVTTQGLYVYRGPGGSEHQVRHFVPLARASVKSAQLVAIDRAARKGKPPIR